MRSAIYVHNARRFVPGFSGGEVSPSTVFYLATLGGARALRLEELIGSLEPGKEADFVVLNTSHLSPVGQSDEAQKTPDALLSRLVFRADERMVEQAYVRGRLLYDDQKPASGMRESDLMFPPIPVQFGRVRGYDKQR